MSRQHQPKPMAPAMTIVLLAIGVFAFSNMRIGKGTKDLAFVTARDPQSAAASSREVRAGDIKAQASGVDLQKQEQATTSSKTQSASNYPTTRTAFGVVTGVDSLFSNLNQTIEPGAKLTALKAKNQQDHPMRYSVTRGAFPGTILLNSTGEFSGTAFASGKSDTEVQAIDQDGTATTLNVAVAVQNGAPRFSATASNSVQSVSIGQTPLPLTAIDPNLEVVIFSQGSGTLPNGLSLASNGSFIGTALQVGIYSSQIVAHDEHGAEATTDLQLIVGPLSPTRSKQQSEQNSNGSAVSAAGRPQPPLHAPTSAQSSPATSASASITAMTQPPSESLMLAGPISALLRVPPESPLQPASRIGDSAMPLPPSNLPSSPATLTASKTPPKSDSVGPTTSPNPPALATDRQVGSETPSISEPPLAEPPLVDQQSQRSEVTGTRSRLNDPATAPGLKPPDA